LIARTEPANVIKGGAILVGEARSVSVRVLRLVESFLERVCSLSGCVMCMKIRLVSTDQRLYELCRESLDANTVIDWETSAQLRKQPVSPQETCLWDFTTLAQIPSWWMDADRAKLYFLLEERELKGFRQQTGHSDVNIILKPVTRSTLEAFFGVACEVGVLAERPNDMGESLRSDRDRILQCLIQTNLRLQQIEQGRNDFIARTIHDFRAPLTAIEGYCGLLVSEILGSLRDSQVEVLQRMQYSAQRLSRMASALFQLTTDRHVNLQPRFEPSDISECLEQAVHEITPYLGEKYIDLTIDLETVMADFYFDRAQIERLLVNLLDNACKYTPTRGHISVCGRVVFGDMADDIQSSEHCSTNDVGAEMPGSQSYRVEIQDTGPGISPEILGHIFEEYATYSHGADRSGGGLGLAISKMIVERHQGRIWGENCSTGARFVFVLPLRPGSNNVRLSLDDVNVTAGRMPC
jgi:signal transduction histidine kinase